MVRLRPRTKPNGRLLPLRSADAALIAESLSEADGTLPDGKASFNEERALRAVEKVLFVGVLAVAGAKEPVGELSKRNRRSLRYAPVDMTNFVANSVAFFIALGWAQGP